MMMQSYTVNIPPDVLMLFYDIYNICFAIPAPHKHYWKLMAERGGFEPPTPF
jgi:hypothetical protein